MKIQQRLDQYTAQTRAVLKLSALVLTMTLLSLALTAAVTYLGADTVIYILAVTVALFILRTVYQIQLAQEQYRDSEKQAK